jgi:uridine monophosphate synthetase
LKEIILQLYDIGAIKFGSFLLKNGDLSPIYIDLRESISYPPLLKAIAEQLWKKIGSKKFDKICGVPYTALPLASYLSIAYDIPMVMRRKEQKDHGTKKIIEGVFSTGQVCLILEDLITSGASILETISPIEEAGMKVHDVAVFLDRQQGGCKRLEGKGYRVHSATTLSEMLKILHSNQRLDSEMRDKILAYTNECAHA